MADFHKGLELLVKEPQRRRATFVHGQPALVERFVRAWRAPLATITRLDLQNGSQAPLWDALGTLRLDDSSSHGILVRNAQLLTDDEHAEQLAAWVLSRRVHNTYALFVADFENWPEQRNAKIPLNPAIREIFMNARKSSLLVTAQLAQTEIGHTKAAQLVRSVHPALGWTGARAVLEHTQWDLHLALEAARKGRIVGTAHVEHIKALSAHEAKAEYIEALVACDKVKAAVCAADVPEDAYGTTVARLDYALDVLARVHRTQKFKESTHALAARMNVNRVVITRYRPHARHYTSVDVARRTQALLWADEQVRKGRRKGVLEMVAVQW